MSSLRAQVYEHYILCVLNSVYVFPHSLLLLSAAVSLGVHFVLLLCCPVNGNGQEDGCIFIRNTSLLRSLQVDATQYFKKYNELIPISTGISCFLTRNERIFLTRGTHILQQLHYICPLAISIKFVFQLLFIFPNIISHWPVGIFLNSVSSRRKNRFLINSIISFYDINENFNETYHYWNENFK